MPAQVELKPLREQRGQIFDKMKTLSATAAKEDRGLSAEERTQWDKLDKEQESLRGRIETAEKENEIEKELSVPKIEAREKADFIAKKKDRPTSAEYRLARAGFALGPEYRGDQHEEAMKRCGLRSGRDFKMKFSRKVPKSYADIRESYLTRSTTDFQLTGDSTLGGNAIQNEPMMGIERALLSFGGVREAARVVRTNTGATLQIPTNNDATNSASIVAETTNRSIDVTNIQFGQTTMTAFTYSSNFVKASIEFMQDLSFDFDGWLTDVLGERVARGTNADFTTSAAAHTAAPQGVQTMALHIPSTGVALTYDGLVQVEHGLDPAYRRMPGTRWMFHDTTLKRIKQLVDSQGRLLWVPGVAMGEPDTLLGYPYTVNQSAATDNSATTGIKRLMFGDFNHYIVRDVMDVILRRADERFIEAGVVGFVTLSRHDGVLVQPSTVTPPIVAMITAT